MQNIKNLTVLFIVLWTITAQASSVRWLVKPKTYEKITYYCEDIFLCQKSGKYQLVDLQGKTLLPNPVDSITQFTEGYALVLEDTRDTPYTYKILGFLSEASHDYIPLKADYYMGVYSFFSDGYIAVNKEKQKNGYGYLDTRGNEVISFKYQSARPYIRGLASVKNSKGKALYINKQEKALIVHFSSGVLEDATSFNQEGKAVVCNKKNAAVIDTTGHVIQENYNKVVFTRKHDFAFNESGQDDDVSPCNKQPEFDNSISVEMFIPWQFTDAQPFANRCAIVAMQDHYGIITLTDEDVICAFSNDKDLRIDPETSIDSLSLSIEIPDYYDKIQLIIGQGDNQWDTIHWKKDNGNELRLLPLVGKKAKTYTLYYRIYGDDLLLKEGRLSKNIKRIEPINITVGQPISEKQKANPQGILKIKTMVTNHSKNTLTINVNFNIPFSPSSNNKCEKNKDSATLGPNESKDFFAELRVVDKETVKVTATATVNGKKVSKENQITLIPNDTE